MGCVGRAFLHRPEITATALQHVAAKNFYSSDFKAKDSKALLRGSWEFCVDCLFSTYTLAETVEKPRLTTQAAADSILPSHAYSISVWGGHLTSQQRQRINEASPKVQVYWVTILYWRLFEEVWYYTFLAANKPCSLIAFILSYLVTISLMSSFWEKEGIHLPSRTVLITCI